GTTGVRRTVAGSTTICSLSVHDALPIYLGEQVAQTVTDASGSYSFTGLLPGDYLIKEEDKAGWVHISPVQLNLDSVTSGQNIGNHGIAHTRPPSTSRPHIQASACHLESP